MVKVYESLVPVEVGFKAAEWGLFQSLGRAESIDKIDLDYEYVAEKLFPLFLDRLRALGPPQAQVLAEAAATPGLDELSLYALADWLEEQRLPALGARVRKMALQDGDLLVIQPDKPLGEAQMARLREGAQTLYEKFAAEGRTIHIIVLPHGLDLHHKKTGKV